MYKEKILVDVDGTIADIHIPFAEKISRDFKTNFSVEDINDFGFGQKIKGLGLDPKSCVDIVHRLWVDQWESVPVIDPFAVSVLSSLKQNFRVDIVTANESHEFIRKWLLKNSIPHHNFIFHPNKHELDYDIFIEDDDRLFKDRLKPSQMLLLKDRPYNRNLENNGNVIRFRSFEDVLGIVGKLRI